jgi:hypothetical protein
MTRLALGIGMVVLAACAGSREVSKLRYTSTDCPDPNGCEAPLAEREYQRPDEARDPVADAAATADRPSCKTVAIALAAIELGNYASEDTDEERASIVEQQTKTCEAAKLDEREIACMSTVSEPKHVGYCTRKMGAPTQRVSMLSKAECQALVGTMRSTMYGGMEQHASVYEVSCTLDGWSTELATCIRERGSYDPVNQCRSAAPGWVCDQLQARLEAPKK